MPQLGGTFVTKVPRDFCGTIYPINFVRVFYADLETSVRLLLDSYNREASRDLRLSDLRGLGFPISGSRNGDIFFERDGGLSSSQLLHRIFEVSHRLLIAPSIHGAPGDIFVVLDGYETGWYRGFPSVRRYRIPLEIVESVLQPCPLYGATRDFQPWNPSHVVLGVLEVNGGMRESRDREEESSRRLRSQSSPW